uniref:Uncharacterized protein n=1 Tax=Cacopsylla melanoneura TaxID=428564 RepID=A0A8D9DXV4_9HEMI
MTRHSLYFSIFGINLDYDVINIPGTRYNNKLFHHVLLYVCTYVLCTSSEYVVVAVCMLFMLAFFPKFVSCFSCILKSEKIHNFFLLHSARKKGFPSRKKI